jgi:hypothetical protein
MVEEKGWLPSLGHASLGTSVSHVPDNTAILLRIRAWRP